MEKENEKKVGVSRFDTYKTDLRREVIARRKELTRIHLLNREKTQDKRLSRPISRSVVTIDTNKARSNIHVLRLAIRELGWKEFPFQRRDHNCDITWHAISFHDQSEIYSGQVNKFPGSVEIFRKVNTFRWLEFMKTLFPDEYSFFPRTWLLPHQFNEFANSVKSHSEKKPKEKPMYIVKPSEGSQGDGIYLLQDPHSYNNSNSKCHVVQEYLSNVFLIDGYKFDLRVYVVLKCLEPLEFYICKEGLARFSTLPYEQPSNRNMHETFMHLTNYSLNKKSSDFKISDKDDEGSKRKMSAVFAQLQNLGYDMGIVWKKIEHLVTKTLIAVVGELKVEYQAAIPPGKPGPTCFQVLGFDILLLQDLQPMLLEVNSNPSLSITEEHDSPTGGVEYLVSTKDEEVKRTLIRDTLILVAPKNKYTRRRRRRRHRRRLPNNDDEEEDMETDDTSHNHKNKRNQRLERDISITYVEGESTEAQKSMFDKLEYYGSKRHTRNENSRMFIEGEGEVFFQEEESEAIELSENPVKENEPGRLRGLKRWIIKKAGRNKRKEVKMNTRYPLPSIFPKTSEQSEEMITEEESPERGETDPLSHELSDNGEDVEEDYDYDERLSCLKEIFPAVYGDSFRKEQVVEKLADIFITCLGVKGCLRLGPGMFRMFARKCHLNRKGVTNAAIDIMYIDIQRKWDYMNPDGTSGISFFAFVCGCCRIASEAFSGNTLQIQIQNFVEHCQNFLKIPTDLEIEAAKRALRYGLGFGRSREKDSLVFPSAYDRPKNWGAKDWPKLLDESYDDRIFPFPHRQHRNIFHMLQSIKK